MNVPNLRDFDSMAQRAKHVDQTKMLDTDASEPSDTVKSDHGANNREYINSGMKMGKLGATGRE